MLLKNYISQLKMLLIQSLLVSSVLLTRRYLPLRSVVSRSSTEAAEAVFEELAHFLRGKNKVVCITGAGCSTNSGIPDYRGENGSYKKGHKPMMHQEFVVSAAHRKRYWGRSLLGWKSFHAAKPNDAHYALANLESMGILSMIITQNVDRLHQKAGSVNVIDLHGRNDRVVCLSEGCGCSLSRRSVQEQIAAMNREFVAKYLSPSASSLRADGDAELGLSLQGYDQIVVPACPKCGGILKPEVVFFGDNIPAARSALARSCVNEADGLLVVGSSLEVFSALRLVRRAIELNIPVAILNQGETRAEREGLPLTLKLDSDCAKILSTCVKHIKGQCDGRVEVASL